MRNRPSFAMSAIVLGTYVCALYAARGTPVSARATSSRPVYPAAATRPAAVRPVPVSVAEISSEAR